MKKIILSPNPYRDKNFKYANLAAKLLREVGMEVRICLSFQVEPGFVLPHDTVLTPMDRELKDADLLVCFGGDGTILHASKAATYAGVPVLGVNIGTMGFMAELESSDLKELTRLAEGDYSIEERMMLHVQVEREGRIILDENALNDVVITKGAVARVVQLTVQCDGREMMSFGGDGVIVCTPTGSTAYSMSAGGPIVEPAAENLIVTPICAHDMMTRTVVTGADRTITVQVGRIGRKNAYLSADGGKALRLNTGDRVIVKKSNYATKLVRLSDRSFFDVVKNKFNK